jgi:hypothetical protein
MNQEDIMQNRVAANKHLLYIILFIFIIGFFYIISTTKNTYLSKYLPTRSWRKIVTIMTWFQFRVLIH